jgi:hypothetical protein
VLVELWPTSSFTWFKAPALCTPNLAAELSLIRIE